MPTTDVSSSKARSCALSPAFFNPVRSKDFDVVLSQLLAIRILLRIDFTEARHSAPDGFGKREGFVFLRNEQRESGPLAAHSADLSPEHVDVYERRLPDPPHLSGRVSLQQYHMARSTLDIVARQNDEVIWRFSRLPLRPSKQYQLNEALLPQPASLSRALLSHHVAQLSRHASRAVF